ncbi:phosphate transporter PHO1 homolog 9 [Cryptomeria japonica]|uniref:phosphate transporter PHO1 homolog 9 n=1 Tax=Cryptomeria japonica TaxID=3369 RepID=UPI0027DA9AC6|nr:phosphate transporter PHO1 homolog 9 [Cryptomeria japonica]
MKFGKEFVAQMVHEWHEAYMDYNFLKTMLKDIIRHKARPKPKPIPNAINPPSGGIKRAMTFRSFSGLLRRDSISEEEIIVVKSQEEDGNDSIETMFSRTAEQGTEYEVLFFKRLDEELNRVNRFYRGRVEEIVKEAAELNKQISSLVACKYIVRNKPGQELENSDIAGNTPPNPEKRSGPVHMEEINDVRLRITPNTPPCTILSIPDSPDKKTLYKRDLRRANKMVRTACIAFYQKLTLLKSYSSLNLLAFSKIMKKYDKISGRRTSRSYLNIVEKSYLISSEEVNTLLKRVEEMFTKHFATGIHSKAVKILRPTRKRKRHSLTFFIGFFTGCSMALLVALILLVVVQNVYNDKEASRFMESVFPLYSMLGFIFVHMFMYGADLYFWQYFRINYPFIFEFNWGTELGFRELFLIATALSVMTLSGAILNLNLGTKSLSIPGDFVPLTLVVVLLLALFLPFKILYQSSRLFLLRTALHCIFVPFYKVSLPDFFLADQLTSQVQAIRVFEYFICYYSSGDFKRRQTDYCTIKGNNMYTIFYFIVAVIPYWIRFLQCMRRLVEESDVLQGYNALKYLSTILSVVIRTAYDQTKRRSWKIASFFMSSIATIVSTYWDLVIDWGLLQRNSQNPWLRDKLLIKNKSIYFIAMVTIVKYSFF